MSTIRDLAPWNWVRRRADGEGAGEHPLELFQRQVNRLFDEFFTGVERDSWGGRGFSPRINVSETEKDLQVSAELPGLDEGDIDISLTRDTLTLRGHKKSEREHKEGENFFVTERTFGSFARVIPLSCEVEEERVDAQFKRGVLHVTLPKVTPSQGGAKKIHIKSS